MHITFENFAKVKYLFAFLALVIVAISTYFTNGLVKSVAQEEERKMTLWAEATRKVASVGAVTDFDFLLRVIEDNTTIPCFILDQNNRFVGARNIVVPQSMKPDEAQLFWLEKQAAFADLHDPIVIAIDHDTRQYIYYDNSLVLLSVHRVGGDTYLLFGGAVLLYTGKTCRTRQSLGRTL